MADNGNHPGMKAVEVRKRTPGSGPILVLAILFVAATCMAWYFSWFGRELSDADISKYLSDEKNPRHVQHALLQIQQRIESGDASARTWYPQLLTLSENRETEFRLTVAWLMGFDNSSAEFHQALLRLLQDQEPIVRRNAALALVRFGDSSGREEILLILKPYVVKAPAGGTIESTMQEGAIVARRALLARITQADGSALQLRSPLAGKVKQTIKAIGSQVTQGDDLLTLNSDEQSVREALRALAIVGRPEDLSLVQSFANSDEAAQVKAQADLTARAISFRSTQKDGVQK